MASSTPSGSASEASLASHGGGRHLRDVVCGGVPDRHALPDEHLQVRGGAGLQDDDGDGSFSMPHVPEASSVRSTAPGSAKVCIGKIAMTRSNRPSRTALTGRSEVHHPGEPARKPAGSIAATTRKWTARSAPMRAIQDSAAAVDAGPPERVAQRVP